MSSYTVPKQLIFMTLLALSLINLVACSGVKRTQELEGPLLQAGHSYAIDLSGAMLEVRDQHPSDDDLEGVVRASLKDQLRKRGLVEAPASEATWLVLPSLRVFQRAQKNDAYFAFDTNVDYEEAQLTIELLSGSDSARAWSGSTRTRLRNLRRGSGLYRVRTVELDENRNWGLEQMAADIVMAIP